MSDVLTEVDLTEQVDDFMNKKQDEETALTLEFAKAILGYQLQQKQVGEFIKDSKKDAKANGILVGDVMKVLKELKDELKQTDIEKIEKSHLKEVLLEDFDIKFKLQQLNEKTGS